MIYSNFRIFFNPPNGLRHRPYSKRPLHSHKLVSISNQAVDPGSSLNLLHFLNIFLVDDPMDGMDDELRMAIERSLREN